MLQHPPPDFLLPVSLFSSSSSLFLTASQVGRPSTCQGRAVSPLSLLAAVYNSSQSLTKTVLSIGLSSSALGRPHRLSISYTTTRIAARKQGITGVSVKRDRLTGEDQAPGWVHFLCADSRHGRQSRQRGDGFTLHSSFTLQASVWSIVMPG